MTRGHFKTVFAGFAASFMVAVSGVFGVTPASAAKAPETYLLVSPASQTLGKLEPGKTYENTFLVKNIGTETTNFKIYPAPYYEEGEDGEKTYTVTNNYTYLSEWIKFDIERGTLKPQESVKVTYRVKVPAGTAGGAQNAAIMVESEDTKDSSKVVSASSRIAMILFSQVNGETNACGKIVYKSISNLLLNPPIIASGRVENCGNIDLNVKYVMEVFPLFSDEPVYSNENQPKILATLPETRRYTALEWENTPSFGLYKVKLSITYNGETEKIEKIVLVCPLWLIVLIIVFIGALIFWLVSRSRERKEKKSNKTVEK